MTGLQYLIRELKKYGVTDSFGIPGAVILDMIYGFEENGISTHLTYHEQAAGFAACGYAQKGNRLGVAYATKGPGFTNLITAIADAYYDSLPVLFITAHSNNEINGNIRYLANQEMDTVDMVKKITKYSERIDCIEDVIVKIPMACKVAMQDRKGPAFLDINSRLFMTDIGDTQYYKSDFESNNLVESSDKISETICDSIAMSSRPVVLIGNGVRYQSNIKELQSFCERNYLPILSSRVAMDCMAGSSQYYGYIGSRGLRYSNYILDKCDLIISFGNRMSYNLESESFKGIMDNKQVIRLEIDEFECQREIPNTQNFLCNISDVIAGIADKNVDFRDKEKWNSICKQYKESLNMYDLTDSTHFLISMLERLPEDVGIVSDVGNNSIWLSRAYSYSEVRNQLFFSMGFSSLGNALCKAEGMYYTDKKYVACIVGDQGFQLNVQELEFFSKNKIPVLLIVVNNNTSGMIHNWEMVKFDYDWHTTPSSGYGEPSIRKIAEAYGISYVKYEEISDIDNAIKKCERGEAVIVELLAEQSEKVAPMLKKGDPCYDMSPYIPNDLKKQLEGVWDCNYG